MSWLQSTLKPLAGVLAAWGSEINRLQLMECNSMWGEKWLVQERFGRTLYDQCHVSSSIECMETSVSRLLLSLVEGAATCSRGSASMVDDVAHLTSRTRRFRGPTATTAPAPAAPFSLKGTRFLLDLRSRVRIPFQPSVQPVACRRPDARASLFKLIHCDSTTMS